MSKKNFILFAWLAIVMLSTTMALPSGLIGWWQGEGNTLDATGNGNNGANIGNVSYANGKFGQAFSFNGSSAVSITDDPVFNNFSTITISTWVNLSSYTNPVTRQSIVSFKEGDSPKCRGCFMFV